MSSGSGRSIRDCFKGLGLVNDGMGKSLFKADGIMLKSLTEFDSF